MFGCGQVRLNAYQLYECRVTVPKYPAHDAILASVKEEATQTVKRLRHHPSVVIFGRSLHEHLTLEAILTHLRSGQQRRFGKLYLTYS